MKIAILLPYKENFSVNYAGAVSLFVKDVVKNSKYFKTTYVFGNMVYKKAFLNNYINLPLKKKFFESSSKIYINEFIKKEKNINSDIIEIHNRPNYVKFLKELLYTTNLKEQSLLEVDCGS